MNRNLHNAMMAQYATPKVSGDGMVSWDKGVKCVLPSVKLFGAAVQGTLTGKNLLNPDDIVIGGVVGGTGKFFETKNRIRTGYIPVKALTRYVVSCPYVIQSVHQYKSDKSWIGLISVNKPLTSADCAYLIITIRKEDGLDFEDADLDTAKMGTQLEEGVVATAYEPYCGGIPAPNPGYPIMPVCNDGAVVARGRNLWPNFVTDKSYDNGSTVKVNSDGSISVHKVAGESINIRCKIALPAGEYTMSNGISSGSKVYLQIDAGDNFISSLTKPIKNLTVTAPTTCTFYLYSDRTTDGIDVTLYPQFVLGAYTADTMPPYTHYWDGGQATAPELWAIPGTDIRDEWDAQTGWGVRRVKKLVLDGTETGRITIVNNLQFASIYIDNLASTNATAKNHSVCTHYSYGSSANKFYINAPGTLIRFQTEDSLDDFMSYLSAQYEAGTPVTVWYALAEPEPFYSPPTRLTMPKGMGQIIQVSGSVPDCPIEASYLTRS